MMKMTYPDAEVLTYQYDSGGLVKSVAGVKGNFTYDYIKRLEYDKFEQRAFIVYGNNTKTTYAYNAQNRRLNNLKSGKGDGSLFQNLNYGYDNVGNILSLANNVPVPPPSQFGGPTTQSFGYDDLYRLTNASGTYQFAPDKTDRYTLSMVYDNIHNILLKGQNHEIVQASGAPITQKKTTYTWNYFDYSSTHPHAPTHIGDRTFSYDANGNQTGWSHDQNGTRRNIVWDEENRIQSIFDNGQEKTYKYNDTGERVIKKGPQGETVYVNQYFTIRNKEIGTKHIFAGTTRVVSKLMKQDKPGANPQGQTPLEKDLYFYHPDHLGSSNYITDTNGSLYQHLEYFPFGETWVEEASNTQRTPYLFTGKELDPETGLYYFGARYYDPRTSVWQSGDPAFRDYVPSATKDTGAELGGMGGVFNSLNLHVYGYAHQNPVGVLDPSGEKAFKLFSAGGRAYFLVIQYDAGFSSLRAGVSSVSDFSRVPGISARHNVYDADIVDNAFKYSNVTPDETKALMLSESGGGDKRSREAFKTDPMQVLVPGDFTTDKGKFLEIKKNEPATPEKSIHLGTKWYSHKKDADYNWRLQNIPENTKQGRLLRDPKLSQDPMRGFIGYKGWMRRRDKRCGRSTTVL